MSKPTPTDNDEPPPNPNRATERTCAALILAAGQGTRMKSRLSKLLHPVAGRPMIDSVLDAARGCAPVRSVVVIGHHAEPLRQHLGRRPEPITLTSQGERSGTGGAVMAGLPAVERAVDDVAVLFADQPLITPEMVAAILAGHRSSGANVTTAACVHPTGGQHGRITRDARGNVLRITQVRDLVGEAAGPKEIDSGIFCFRRDWLAAHLPLIPRQPHGEYYLTDLVAIAAAEAADGAAPGAPWPVAAVLVDLDAAMGVNNRVHLAEAERVARGRVNERLMLAGVTITDPASTFIDEGVTIGRDTIVAPFTVISGRTAIGEGCRIGPGARIADSTVADGCTIVDSTVEGSDIGAGSDVGPYSRLRPGTRIAPRVHVGNYVELKNTSIGSGSAIGHMSYLGDATVGERVNIGAGTITANYDGREKHRTTIGDGAFIGVNTMLRAPVEVGPGAMTGGSSFVNRDVPAGRLAVGIPARLVPPHARRAPRDGEEAAPPSPTGDATNRQPDGDPDD